MNADEQYGFVQKVSEADTVEDTWHLSGGIQDYYLAVQLAVGQDNFSEAKDQLLNLAAHCYRSAQFMDTMMEAE